MAKPAGSIEIKRGNRLGKPIAVYASDGAGNMVRHDYATAREARAAAASLSRKSGWRVADRLP